MFENQVFVYSRPLPGLYLSVLSQPYIFVAIFNLYRAVYTSKVPIFGTRRPIRPGCRPQLSGMKSTEIRDAAVRPFVPGISALVKLSLSKLRTHVISNLLYSYIFYSTNSTRNCTKKLYTPRNSPLQRNRTNKTNLQKSGYTDMKINMEYIRCILLWNSILGPLGQYLLSVQWYQRNH